MGAGQLTKGMKHMDTALRCGRVIVFLLGAVYNEYKHQVMVNDGFDCSSSLLTVIYQSFC
jgi:hypothetical protein